MMKTILFAILFTLLVPLALAAQNPASNKAFFTASSNAITLTKVADPTPGPVIILDAPNAIKTSNVGAVTAAVSLECALWTYTPVTAVSGKGQSVVTAHAAVEVWVDIDGRRAEPGQVVYCDRLQAVGLKVDSVCTCGVDVPGVSCTCMVEDTIKLDLFQATKNANSFSFFLGPLNPVIHSVQVKAQGKIECSSDGKAVPCPSAIMNSFANAGTAAAIGKRVLILEEQNNWGTIR